MKNQKEFSLYELYMLVARVLENKLSDCIRQKYEYYDIFLLILLQKKQHLINDNINVIDG